MLKNQLSFNDGLAAIYTVDNVAEAGDQPKNGLTKKRTARFEYRTVGYNRFTQNMQNNVKIEKMILIPWGVRVSVQDVVILTDDVGDTEQYEIMQAQDKTDTAPRSRQLSLRRIEAKYDTETT